MKPYTVITIGYMLLITLLSHVSQEDLPKSDLEGMDYFFTLLNIQSWDFCCLDQLPLMNY